MPVAATAPSVVSGEDFRALLGRDCYTREGKRGKKERSGRGYAGWEELA